MSLRNKLSINPWRASNGQSWSMHDKSGHVHEVQHHRWHCRPWQNGALSETTRESKASGWDHLVVAWCCECDPRTPPKEPETSSTRSTLMAPESVWDSHPPRPRSLARTHFGSSSWDSWNSLTTMDVPLSDEPFSGFPFRWWWWRRLVKVLEVARAFGLSIRIVANWFLVRGEDEWIYRDRIYICTQTSPT